MIMQRRSNDTDVVHVAAIRQEDDTMERDLTALVPSAREGLAIAVKPLAEARLRAICIPGLDDTELFQMLQRVACAGRRPWAMDLLGQFYGNGIGVQTDVDAATTWIARATEHGCADAQLRLALLCLPDDPAARPTVDAAARNGSYPAYLLGEYLEQQEVFTEGLRNELARQTAKAKAARGLRHELKSRTRAFNQQHDRDQQLIAAKEKTIAELTERLESRSPSILEERNKRLESHLVEERRRQEELRKATNAAEQRATEAERRSRDQERRIKYLENLMRKSGIRFNGIMRHGKGHGK